MLYSHHAYGASLVYTQMHMHTIQRGIFPGLYARYTTQAWCKQSLYQLDFYCTLDIHVIICPFCYC